MSRLRRGLVGAGGVRAAGVAADVGELPPFLAEPQFGDELPEQARVLLGEPAASQDQDVPAGELGLERRLVGRGGQRPARCRPA
jgi:hypothetical protein